MLTDKLILALSVALCVILVWVIKLQYPSYFSQGSLFAQIATVIILGVGILIYWKMTDPVKRCVSFKNGGEIGSCELDTDCNSANNAGTCGKDSNGNCVCTCSNGWSGVNCETHGIPWDSPNCMGTNPQSPKNTKPGDMCVCPNDNWASGNGPLKNGGDGYVQCLKCSGTGSDQWGPDPSTASESACTDKWRSVILPTRNCFINKGSCDEFLPYLKYKGPNGASPTINITETCGATTSCRCSNMGRGKGSQTTCAINSWVDPSINNVVCADLAKERPCQSYQCINLK